MRAVVGGSGKDTHAAAGKPGKKRPTEDNLRVRDGPGSRRRTYKPQTANCGGRSRSRSPARPSGEMME